MVRNVGVDLIAAILDFCHMLPVDRIQCGADSIWW